MTAADPDALRAAVRRDAFADEAATVGRLAGATGLTPADRMAIAAAGAGLVRRIRAETQPTLMESFLAEYGLSTDEGVGLMCLAEALLRVPDARTIDELIADKIEPSDWGAHLGHSASPLVNASTWALMLTGRVLDDDPARPAASLRGLLRRLGEPVVRTAVARAMRLLGSQFVLAETIGEALEAARPLERRGYACSFDMLGEAARTDADARRYHAAYADAIAAIAGRARAGVRDSPGISVKLSALHPRYETLQRPHVLDELVGRTAGLARAAAAADIGCNIDAEEQDRLDLSLDVIERVLADPALAGWDGFGVVVQAYGKRAPAVIDWLDGLARTRGRRLMVRLVKGAYWDGEIKLAQELGADTYPVFTRKCATDVAYLACARMLLDRRERLYPQFATHNAHTVAAVLHMAGGQHDDFEFQRLHGMGEALHEMVRADAGTRARIYAPVGAHRDLLAYLVRRLLENGANSSFVNRIVDPAIAPEEVARDPLADLEKLGDTIANPAIPAPADLYGSRRNARGIRINEPASVGPLLAARAGFARTAWTAAPMPGRPAPPLGPARPVLSPGDPARQVGTVADATPAEVADALDQAVAAAPGWAAVPVAERAGLLRRIADAYEAAMPEFCALLAREAARTLADAVSEVRETVDFLRFYAAEAERLERQAPGRGRGVFVCISPWNFPLAIFTGQVAAALAAGNAVIAKPAEQTPLVAARAVGLMRACGLPAAALQLLPGDGPTVGAALVADPRIAGVAFTGSTEAARAIHRALAGNAGPDAVLIAETGGLNATIVDSTALPEQAVRDIVISAFQSAGQRCSALRILYVQEEARARLVAMLTGAMDALRAGDAWDPATDVPPVIEAAAASDLNDYVAAAGRQGRLLHRVAAAPGPCRVAPALVAVDGIADLEREVFGPVLHVASFRARDLDRVVDAINRRGYGLTFALHTRIDDRVQQVVDRLRVGNVYVNRNQIGAVVGVQPFGGEGLSGTGPKAGGPLYVDRFRRTGPPPAARPAPAAAAADEAEVAHAVGGLDAAGWQARPDRVATLRRLLAGRDGLVRQALNAAAGFDTGPFELPGPTGESNRLGLHPRGAAPCLGPVAQAAGEQGV